MNMSNSDADIINSHHKKQVVERKIREKKAKEGGPVTGSDPAEVVQARTHYESAVRDYNKADHEEKASAAHEVKQATSKFESAGEDFVNKKTNEA
jgi:hypothetical protein